jgi:hypothetical protein
MFLCIGSFHDDKKLLIIASILRIAQKLFDVKKICISNNNIPQVDNRDVY